MQPIEPTVLGHLSANRWKSRDCATASPCGSDAAPGPRCVAPRRRHAAAQYNGGGPHPGVTLDCPPKEIRMRTVLWAVVFSRCVSFVMPAARADDKEPPVPARKSYEMRIIRMGENMF